MSTIPDPREDKLPAWARRQLASARQEAAYHRARAEVAQEDADRVRRGTNPDASSAVLHPYDSIPVGLGPDARVRFKLGNRHDWIDVRVSNDGRWIEVAGARTLTLRPIAGNVVSITSEGW
jgi:hypothetical protein